MQLPRGTFHSHKKSIKIGNLLKELADRRFSGHCTIQIGNNTAALVYENGNCLLAEIPPYAGKEALNKISKIQSAEISAELYSQTESQIKLSSEFNTEYRTSDQKSKISSDKTFIKRTMPNNKSVTDNTKYNIVARNDRSHPSLREKNNELLNLPRGNFYALKKSIIPKLLINELKNSRFFGYVIILIEDRKATLVFKDEACILADCPPKRGEQALAELMDLPEDTYDAELYTLTYLQMNVCIEYNELYETTKLTKTTVSETKIPELQKDKFPADIEAIQNVAQTQPRNYDDDDDFNEQIRTFEKMNIEDMSDRLRANLRDVIRGLDLGHLIEEKDKQDCETGKNLSKDIKSESKDGNDTKDVRKTAISQVDS
ncbi:MAG: hypothetical protein KAW93_03340 [Methanogenium sp.]|nr:hypothetical protein [Methanogenium sp.]